MIQLKELQFTFNNDIVVAREGDTIAAALEVAGHRKLGRRMSAHSRGVYCGMGVCQDCVVTVDGVRSVLACMAEVRAGMMVSFQDDRAASVHAMSDFTADPEVHAVDLFIVGAGPAGLEAAISAREAGLNVLVADERSAPGGQYLKPPSRGSRKQGRDRQHRQGDALRGRFAASGARLEQEANVWFARRKGSGFSFRYIRTEGETVVNTRAVVLATGAHERPAVVPGWTDPGVMTIGAAQNLARRYGVAPGHRILIAGQGPLGLQLAVELLDLDADVVGVADRSRMSWRKLARAGLADPMLGAKGLGYLARLARARVPLWPNCEIAGVGAVTAEDGHREVRLEDVEGNGARTVEADTVCMGDGFLPQIELARLLGCAVVCDDRWFVRVARDEAGATNVPGLWIAGDGGGLGGAQAAQAQGRLAGLAAARFLGRNALSDGKAFSRLKRARRFQAALWSAYDAPQRSPPSGATIVCRCESITANEITVAIKAGAGDPGTVKRVTRCGMGRCQGRFCYPTLVALLRQRGIAVRPENLTAPQVPARPIRATRLAREKPEWGGHRATSPSARPEPPDTAPLPAQFVDLVVIGAGVTGLCAALHAANNGASVLCLDRGRAGGEASGGNAGSLHLQLLSWDFGSKAVAGGSLALQTLPLQAESIGRWAALEAQLSAIFQMKVTGGLMLAENPDQIVFLKAKATAEAEVGIETRVVDPIEIAAIAPNISDRFVAAAWCPGEGKINPLVANHCLLAALRDAGGEVAELCPVRGIRSRGSGYDIETSRGTVRAQRIVIASGGWSAQLGAMLGEDLPVRGAPLQMVATEPAPPLVNCLVTHADRHLTLKQTSSGSILIGGAWPATVNADGQPQVLPESLEGNLWVAARTLPAVAELKVIRSWAAMNIDIDGAPLLAQLPGHPRVVVAVAANGYTLGPLIGQEAAAGVLGGKMRSDLAAFDLSRF